MAIERRDGGGEDGRARLRSRLGGRRDGGGEVGLSLTEAEGFKVRSGGESIYFRADMHKERIHIYTHGWEVIFRLRRGGRRGCDWLESGLRVGCSVVSEGERTSEVKIKPLTR